MPYRTKKLMHYPCRDCGVLFERFGRYVRFCKSCIKKRKIEGQKRGVLKSKLIRVAQKQKQ